MFKYFFCICGSNKWNSDSDTFIYIITPLLTSIVGWIGEKMFTSGRKCNFFHKIAQYDANAGNPDSSTFDHMFSLFAIFNHFSGAIPCQVNYSKNLTIFNSAQILDGNSHSGEKQLCQNLEESVKYFPSYAPPKN